LQPASEWAAAFDQSYWTPRIVNEVARMSPADHLVPPCDSVDET